MLPDRPPREQRLANTYARRTGQTGWERVQDYREIRRYCAEHPNAGSQAVATATDMKRSRIRGWVEATSRPEPANAIAVADRHDWLDCALPDRIGAAWTITHAWACGGGSISVSTSRHGLGWSLETQIRRLCPTDSVTVGTDSVLLRPEAAAVLDEPPTLPALDG
ncbi:hypothetical protein [Halosegnis rubeus]|jgi:hypothetical protein|uniref:Uncharacterized protein n=1 Tax=Halosegnis rubeus TaxID=2212850 RepID=A0A5N5UJ11_9EURY|nr:hypothetical protein [Halosegnis rubeus]KAB7518715.1 hypothetical protein DP108_05960 [Halosegnis rubeus]